MVVTPFLLLLAWLLSTRMSRRVVPFETAAVLFVACAMLALLYTSRLGG